MFRNYFITALRNLSRNRFYAAINIAGLAIGFAAATFAALFVRDELTFERWIPGYEQIYTVTSTYPPMRGVHPIEAEQAFRTVAGALELEFPQVEAAARLEYQSDVAVKNGDRQSVESLVAWADPKLFLVLPFPAVAGALNTALYRPDGVVLTRRAARRYFGRDAPIGRTLELDGHPMQVTAVIEDWPSNTGFATQIFASALAPFSALTAMDAEAYTTSKEPYMMAGPTTYVRLRQGASVLSVGRGLPAFTARHLPKELLGGVTLRFRPLWSLHLSPVDAPPRRAGLLAAIYGIGGTGALIVLAAAINFINLMTARAGRRAIEVGVRKATGAQRRQLITQFVGEAVGYTGAGMIAAILLVELLLPTFRSVLGRTIVFDLWKEPVADLGTLAGVVAVGTLAGVYPALVLAICHPATVLRGGNVRGAGSNIARQSLVALQFAMVIALTVSVGVIFRQTYFAMRENLRFEKDEALIIRSGCMPALKAAILELPGVRAAACSWNEPGDGGYMVTAEREHRKVTGELWVTPVDFDYFEVFGLYPLAGRFFERARGADQAAPDSSSNPPVVINASALHKLGFESPQAAIGAQIEWRRMLASREAVNGMPLLPSAIIGVVADFSMSVERPIQPQIYYADMRISAPIRGALVDYDFPQILNVKLTGHDVPETLAAIERLARRWGSPRAPIKPAFVDQRLEEIYRDITREGQVFAALCVVAILIASLGLIGLAASTSERRTKEIGIRKAMGASRADILRLLLWQFAKPVLWANAIAWPAAYLVMRHWLEGFAYHIDLALWMFVSASAAALVIALVTVIGHALTVARSQPVAALRYE